MDGTPFLRGEGEGEGEIDSSCNDLVVKSKAFAIPINVMGEFGE